MNIRAKAAFWFILSLVVGGVFIFSPTASASIFKQKPKQIIYAVPVGAEPAKVVMAVTSEEYKPKQIVKNNPAKSELANVSSAGVIDQVGSILKSWRKSIADFFSIEKREEVVSKKEEKKVVATPATQQTAPAQLAQVQPTFREQIVRELIREVRTERVIPETDGSFISVSKFEEYQKAQQKLISELTQITNVGPRGNVAYTIGNPTFTGTAQGLGDDDIPDDITIGSTKNGSFSGNLTVGGDLTVSGNQNIPNLSVTGKLSIGSDTVIIDGVNNYITSPSNALSIYTTSTPLAISALTATSTFSSYFTGNLGIGTTTPGAGLSVQATSTILGGSTYIYGTSSVYSLNATATLAVASSSPGNNNLAVTGHSVLAGNVTITGALDIQGACVGCGSPGGQNTQVQFNSGSSFAGDSGLVYSSPSLIIGGDLSLNGSDINIGNGISATSTLSGEYGRLGLASTTPFGQFSIEANSSIVGSSTPIFVIGDQGTGTPFIYVSGNNGNIGVGTDAPGSIKLFVSDDSASAVTPLRIEAGALDGNAKTVTLEFAGQSSGSTALSRIQGGHENGTNPDSFLAFLTRESGGSVTEKARFTADGTLLVGDTTDTSGVLTAWDKSTNNPTAVNIYGGSTANDTGKSVTLNLQGRATSFNSGAQIIAGHETSGAAAESFFAIQVRNSASTTNEVIKVLGSNLNVGISTTSPGAKLAVAGGGVFKGNLAIEATSTVSSLIATSTLSVGTSTPTSNNQLAVQGNAYITQGFGIGAATTSAGGLFVKGSADIYDGLVVRGGRLIVGSTAASNDIQIAHFEKNQNNITDVRVRNTTAGTLAESRFLAVSDNGNSIGVGIKSSSFTTAEGIAADEAFIRTPATGLVYSSTAGYHRWLTGSGGTERIRLLNGGELLVGASTQVSTELGLFSRSQNASTLVYVRNATDGASASAALIVSADDDQVNGILRATPDTFSDGTYTAKAVHLDAGSSATGGLLLRTTAAAPLMIQTNAIERARFISTGELGLGKTGPTTALDVVGTTTTSGISILGRQFYIGNGITATTSIFGQYGRLGFASSAPYGQISIESDEDVVGSTTPIFVIGDQGTSSPFLYVSGIDGAVGIGTTTNLAADTQIGAGLSVATSTYISGGLGVGAATTSPGGLFVKGSAVVREPSLLVGATAQVDSEIGLFNEGQNAPTEVTIRNTTAGTVSSARLFITSDTANGYLIANSSTFTTVGASQANDFVLQASSADNSLLIQHTGTNPIRFALNGTERMRLNGDSGELIWGATTLTGTEIAKFSKNQNATTFIRVENTTDGASANAQINVIAAGSVNGGIYVTPAAFESGTALSSGFMVEAGSNATGGLGLRTTAAAPIVFQTNSIERARILSTGEFAFFQSDLNIGNGAVATTTIHGEYGKLGFASTSPYGQVSIEANASIVGSTTPIFVIGDQGTSTLFQINWAGVVGIGTSTPAGSEDLNGIGLAVATSTLVGGGLTVVGDVDIQGTCTGCGGATAGGWTDDGTTVRLETATDNVGIGTSTVSNKLEVAGFGVVKGNWNVAATTTVGSLQATTTAYIGATSSPSGNFQLVVQGRSYLTGSTTVSELIFDDFEVASTTVLPNALYDDNIIKGWLSLEIQAGAPTLSDGFNVSSIADATVGVWAWTFQNNMKNTAYVTTGACRAAPGVGDTFHYFAVSEDAYETTGVRFTCSSATTTGVDSDAVYVMIVGQQD